MKVHFAETQTTKTSQKTFVFQIVISIIVGMAAGCIPIVGFNMGAGLKTRVRQLIAIFGAANESVYYTDFAIKAFRIYLCMIVFACINKATFIFLQAMGKAVASAVVIVLTYRELNDNTITRSKNMK